MMPVCQNIPMSFSKYQRPCFESSPPEPWQYHGGHGYQYPYHPYCYNNGCHCFPGFQHPPFFTPHPMRRYVDHYPYHEMYNFYPPHHPMDHTRKFDNDTEKLRSYHSNGHPVNPNQHMSYPYPILWGPPEFMRSEELKKPRADIVKRDKVSDEADHQPKAWDGCFPIDMSTLSPLLESEKEKGGRHEDGKREFLFPNFWMPSYHEQTENPKGIHEKKISPDDAPYTIKLIPLDQFGKDGSEHNLISEETRKGSSKNENIESSGGKGGRRSPPPPKTSKPAPVCLRADPLPRKRIQTRSSNPPASGPRQNYGMSEERTGDLNTSKQVEPDRERIVKVVDVKESECGQADKKYHSALEFPVISLLEPQKVKINCMVNYNKEGQQMVNDEKKNQGAAESITLEAIRKKKISSDEKAAELIQSVYRGYTVRKWDSLKKLNQLSEVKKDVDAVRNRVKDLQSNHPGDEKEKIVVGELIMRLLLKLDTIQGLLPFVREVRKSLAKELVMLQGMVDDMSMIPSGQSSEENVANCQEKSSEEVMELPIMEHVVDEVQHLVLDCPTKSLGSDDAKTTSDEAASFFETSKNVGEAGVMANVLIVEGETELEESSCEEAGEDTITVDVNGLGKDVPMTSEPEEKEEAVTEESFSKKLTPTPIVGDAAINKEEEQGLEVEVIESSTLDSRKLTEAEADAVLDQNHPENEFLQAFNDSVCDSIVLPNGKLRSAENEEIVARVDQTEVSELVKSETVQLADVFSEVSTSEDHQLEQSQAEVVKEERTIALHDEFQVEECRGAKELMGEEEETETSILHFLPKEEGNGKKVEENEQLRQMMEKLMEVGKEQVILISTLSCRVKQLETELKKKKKRMPRSKLFPNRVSLVCK